MVKKHYLQLPKTVAKNLASEIIPSLTFAALPFWELVWPIKRRRPDLRELISECIAADIDFLLEVQPINNILTVYLSPS
jgi:hypothetical protein